MANGKSLLIGFLFGGTISAAATLLSTPRSGKELRQDAMTKGEDFLHTVDKLKLQGTQLKEQITQTSKEGAALVKDLTADMITSIESWKQTIEPHQKNIQKYLEQIEKSLKELEDKTSER
ncbi:YtxH domain-containing protein [Radiobacillus sp. PE A8.2]|uniref:YtxH domain-containing protein n=1 Tax=Radiobacillus sp. PE A8.2 TaxID=3380349 RepID=UPI00388D113A